MLRLSRPRSVTGLRARLGPAVLLVALALTACGWRQQPPHDVPALSDANETYAVVLDTLRSEKYTILEQDAATHAVRVRSHVDESDPKRVSVISLRVDGGAVHLSGSGFLVHPDGTTHHALNSELASLHKKLSKKLASSGQPASSASAAASVAPIAPVAAGEALPLAWSEPAKDTKVWGSGNFTCLPVKLVDAEQTQLSLKLSNGETADVSLSLAHAPELCRSPSACKLPEGCPALGIADAERVARLAGRLAKHEIGPLATLFSRDRALVVIDLSKHGSIAQAIGEKH